MKAYIADIIPRIQQFSEKLDNRTLLCNQHWVLIDKMTSKKHIYIFRSNNDLLISSDGRVSKARWEYLGNKSILIDRQDESLLFKHGFFDSNVLALKRDNCDDFTLFVNENEYDGEINSVEKVFEFLATRYLTINDRRLLKESTGLEFIDPKVEILSSDETEDLTPWIIIAGVFGLVFILAALLSNLEN